MHQEWVLRSPLMIIYHEFKLAIGKALQDNKHITSDNFLDVEEPELVDDDPETPLPDPQG